MMLVPGCKGLGKLTGGIQRVGTMQWSGPALFILGVKKAEFVRVNSMWSFLVQPRHRGNAEAASRQCKAHGISEDGSTAELRCLGWDMGDGRSDESQDT